VSEVVSFKVPKDVKRRMKELKPYVNWSDELRSFLIKRLEEVEREITFKKVMKNLKETGSVPRGFSKHSVRADRDSQSH